MNHLNIIVAYDKNRLIGNSKTNKLPWPPIKEDIQNFKDTTDGSIVVMGRKTWESISKKHRPLKNRINVIISNSFFKNDIYLNTWKMDDSIIEGSRKGNVIVCEIEDVLNNLNTNKDIYIIGGAKIYKEFLDRNVVGTVISTEIKDTFNGDIYFPNLTGDWDCSIIQEHDKFNIVKYTKQV